MSEKRNNTIQPAFFDVAQSPGAERSLTPLRAIAISTFLHPLRRSVQGASADMAAMTCSFRRVGLLDDQLTFCTAAVS